MTSPVTTFAPADAAALTSKARGWQRWLALAFSAILLLVILFELREGELDDLVAALPNAVPFYAAFAVSYLALPMFDWLIYRRLWGLPLASLTPLIKKRVANDVMFGYSGEAYFYLWLRERPGLAEAPLRTIKDVSILSALAGNAMTLLLLIWAWPMLTDLTLTMDPRLLLGSGAVVIAISFAILLFGKKIFYLSMPDLRASFGLHMVRSATSTFFLAMAWYFALPDVGIGYWVMFAALRMVINRLPLIPSKDLLFAAAAMVLTDQGSAMGAVVAMSAGLFLAANLLVGILLTGTDFIGRRRR
ncbi:hypothetical protein KCG44_08165 [Pacificimonas sp. WHA3]|uniref:Transmembrane protein n=1 Tax=Pacificimonas pallii TaxID=2827236 RepID=A0ABS6SEC6_9SPHN|nr:hypothetical protein [Pacificimonas pallii]MBV7256760.1 hypothetical protein [Pacificimonas pallii]